LTVTALAMTPSTFSVPAWMTDPPVKVLPPDKVSIPAPVLFMLPEPEMTPERVPALPAMVAEPIRVRLLAKPTPEATSSAAPALIVTVPVLKALFDPATRVPAFTIVLPA
jgi:hypothetical protein